MFGRRKRKRQLAEILVGDQPQDRLLAAIHDGARAVIDGDAAASLGWPHLRIDNQRGALVDHCANLAKMLSVDQTSIRIFFDRQMEPAIPRSKSVTIELTDDRTAAAERAIEEIEAADVAVGVWSDANAISLRAAGATLFQPDDLLDGFLDLNT